MAHTNETFGVVVVVGSNWESSHPTSNHETQDWSTEFLKSELRCKNYKWSK